MAKSMTLIVKAHALSHLTPTPYSKIKMALIQGEHSALLARDL